MKKCIFDSCDKESDEKFIVMDLHLRGMFYNFCSKDHRDKWQKEFEKRH